MTHLALISRAPEKAQDIPTDVKLVFLADVFTAAAPLFENKDPSNPLPPDTTGGTTT
jgi:hypothetical protein